MFVADRLEGVKWRNWKLVFYEETRDWFGTPSKLTLPKLFNLATDPKEEYPEETLRNTWAMVACLKVIRGRLRVAQSEQRAASFAWSMITMRRPSMRRMPSLRHLPSIVLTHCRVTPIMLAS